MLFIHLPYRSMPTPRFATISILTIVAFWLAILSACGNKPDLLEGKWERFDDQAAGASITVTHNAPRTARNALASDGRVGKFGICSARCQVERPHQKDNNYYVGFDLQKAVDAQGNVANTEYVESYFELLSDDILEITSVDKSDDAFGTRQKLKRTE
ncbi:MAG: hypothetical protein IPL33_18775 [Sphingobacteriales bacterium]|nr:hypothetical protein [Sphingobacteriales bacterium]